jgi:voltage-gated potassium channel
VRRSTEIPRLRLKILAREMARLRHDVGMLTLLVRVLGRNHRRHVLVLLAGAIACVVGGGAAFAATQHAPVTTGLYWAVTTATTVGYGDVTPKDPAGRVVAVAVMLTTIPMLAAVFALVTGAAAAVTLRRILDMGNPFPTGAFRLVVGTHPAVPAILDELVLAGEAVVYAADVDPAKVRDGVHVVRGDPTQPAVIHAARPQDAQQALITGETDGEVLVSAVLLRGHAPDLPLTALVRSASVREALRELGVRQAVAVDDLVAHTLAKSLEAPHAGDLIAQLVDSTEHSLAEIAADAATQGKPLSAIRDERSGLVLGLVHDGQFSMGIGEDPVVAAGDSLLVAEATHRQASRRHPRAGRHQDSGSSSPSRPSGSSAAFEG